MSSAMYIKVAPRSITNTQFSERRTIGPVLRQPRGFTHVSDHARQQLDACRSPRISGQG
jgi:hypothetical protein